MSKSFCDIPGELRVSGKPINFSSDASLSGTYALPVSVQGDVTLAAATEVLGNLTISGTLSNPAGHALTVRGNLSCAQLDFTPTDDTVVQGDLIVAGDLTVDNYHEHNTTITARNNFSDFQVAEDLSALGVPNDGSAQLVYTSGAHLGDTDTFTYDAGTPSTIYPANPTNWVVGTTLTISWSVAASWPVTPVSSPSLTVSRNLFCPGGISMSGMAELQANGGSVSVGGNVYSKNGNILLDAGTYNSVDPSPSGGNGGSFVAGGDVFAQSISCAGMYAYDDAAVNGGIGGSIAIQGNANVTGGLAANGGDTSSANNAGKGGTVTVRGSVFGGGTISANGGNADSSSSTGGAGGTIHLYGDAIATLQAKGGNSGSGDGAVAGTIHVDGTWYGGSVTTQGGDSVGGNGGASGLISIKQAFGDSISANAGSSAAASGKRGGDAVGANNGVQNTGVTIGGGYIGIVTCNGGNTTDAAQRNGACGHIELGPNLTVWDRVELLDGTGGTTPTLVGRLNFAGYCCIRVLDAQNRANISLGTQRVNTTPGNNLEHTEVFLFVNSFDGLQLISGCPSGIFRYISGNWIVVDSSPISATLTDNTSSATMIAQWAVASFTAVQLEYSLSRGSGKAESGRLFLATDGSSASISQQAATLGSPGVTFTVDISGGNLRLLYTTSNTGTNATFKYVEKKWLA